MMIEVMIILLTIVHVIVCFFLVIVVLLQSGKAADLAGAFGGMGSQTAFGPRGTATLLSKITTIAAGVFMLTSLTLAILATKGGHTGASTVLERSGTPAKSAPAAQKGAPAGAGTQEKKTVVEVPLEPDKPAAPQSAPAQSAPAQPPAKK
jgi:preprotein translocase subunit SecG